MLSTHQLTRRNSRASSQQQQQRIPNAKFARNNFCFLFQRSYLALACCWMFVLYLPLSNALPHAIRIGAIFTGKINKAEQGSVQRRSSFINTKP